MADQDPGVFQHIIAALRGRANPDNSNLRPSDMRLQGYRLHVRESQASGETPMPYEQWIKTQTADQRSSPQE